MYNIIQNRKIWFTISSILVIGSLALIGVNGLKLGIDFTGGTLLEVGLNNAELSSGDVEFSILEALPELEEVKVQSSGEQQFIIRTQELSETEHRQIIERLGQVAELTELRFESIGPTLGQELKDKAITALIVAAIIIIIYIAWTFRKVSEVLSSWKYGIGAIVALIHDIVIVTGVYTIFTVSGNYQVDALFVTALLVVLGYSVNDTIVVYDRVRENVLDQKIKDFEEVVNVSVNQTIARSINTSLTTLLVLLSLFFLGGASIGGFVLALIVGVLIGTYSSIFLASPLLVMWQGFKKKK